MPSLLDVLGYAGNALDLPGSSVRDLLTGNNPFDQWLTPFSSDNRATGRDVLNPIFGANEETGMSGWLDNPMEGVKDVAGFGAEMLLDPTNLIPGRAILKALKGRKVAKATNKLIDAENLANAGRYGRVNAKVLMDDMLPEQAVDDVVNPITGEAPQRLLGYTPAPEDWRFPGKEMFRHGGHSWAGSATPKHPYGMFDITYKGIGEGGQAYGPGMYKATADKVSEHYRDLVQKDLDGQFYQSPQALAKYFEPGRIIDQGFRTDKVLDFRPAGPDGNWAVNIQTVSKTSSGDYLPIGPPRWHATQPDIDDMRKVIGGSPDNLPKAKLYGIAAHAGTKQRYMDWDAPLSDQPQPVKDILSNPMNVLDADTHKGLTELFQASARARALKSQSDFMEREIGKYTDMVDTPAYTPAVEAELKAKHAEYLKIADEYDLYDGLVRNLQQDMAGRGLPFDLIQKSGHWNRKQVSLNDAWNGMDGETAADLLMGNHPSDATLADTLQLKGQGVPGMSNQSHINSATKNYVTWDPALIDQMQVRMIDGEVVPINPTTMVEQMAVPARRRVSDADMVFVTNPMREKMEVPNALKPVVAGAVFNLLARQNNYGGAL